ncbi:MAG TPA: sugar-binding protein [Pirellulales bacterium]|nr:sugar-binding protein [Pirellulales bacterium]
MRRCTCLTLPLLAALVGCSNTPPGNTGPAASPGSGASVAGEGSSVTVAFVTNNAHEFWTIARKGTEKAAKELNVEVAFRMPAQGSATEQRQLIEDLLVQGVKGIAVSPNDPTNQAEFFDEVAGKVPLITQDSDLPKGSKRLCFLGTDNYKAGKAAGKLVKEALPEGGRVAIFVGNTDAQNAIDRRQGVLDELAGSEKATGSDLGNYTLIGTYTDNTDKEVCKSKAEDALVQHGNNPETLCLVGLWAYNPPAMLAAVKDIGLAGKVKIVGFDENEETLQGIKDGEIIGTVVQQPFEFGYQAVKMLVRLAQGDKSVLPADGMQLIDYKVIKSDNVEAFHEELQKLKQ